MFFTTSRPAIITVSKETTGRGHTGEVDGGWDALAAVVSPSDPACGFMQQELSERGDIDDIEKE